MLFCVLPSWFTAIHQFRLQTAPNVPERNSAPDKGLSRPPRSLTLPWHPHLLAAPPAPHATAFACGRVSEVCLVDLFARVTSQILVTHLRKLIRPDGSRPPASITVKQNAMTVPKKKSICSKNQAAH